MDGTKKLCLIDVIPNVQRPCTIRTRLPEGYECPVQSDDEQDTAPNMPVSACPSINTMNDLRAIVESCHLTREPDRKRAHEAVRVHHLREDKFIDTRLRYDPNIGYWGVVEIRDTISWKTISASITAPYCTASAVRKQFDEIIAGIRRGNE